MMEKEDKSKVGDDATLDWGADANAPIVPKSSNAFASVFGFRGRASRSVFSAVFYTAACVWALFIGLVWYLDAFRSDVVDSAPAIALAAAERVVPQYEFLRRPLNALGRELCALGTLAFILAVSGVVARRLRDVGLCGWWALAFIAAFIAPSDWAWDAFRVFVVCLTVWPAKRGEEKNPAQESETKEDKSV